MLSSRTITVKREDHPIEKTVEDFMAILKYVQYNPTVVSRLMMMILEANPGPQLTEESYILCSCNQGYHRTQESREGA